MSDDTGQYVQIVAYIFFAAVSVVAVWEWLAPRKTLTAPFRLRWFGNWSLVFIDVALVRATFPVLAIGFSVWVTDYGWGFFHNFSTPTWVAIAISLVVLDLGKYLQHVLLHYVPVLWRVHRIHHADQDYDFTTGMRFHPIEAIFTIGFGFGIIALLGPPVFAVFLSEPVGMAVAIFVHGNVRVPIGLDRVLRYLVITPDMHCVHHSEVVAETNSNFGNFLPWWDRAFRTYTDQPRAGHAGMTIGLPEYRERKHLGLWWMLIHPFQPTPRKSPDKPSDCPT